MTDHHAIAIGSSAGGVETLLRLAEALPRELPAALFVTQHIGGHESLLPELMRARGRLPALHPRDGDAPQAGTIYVAPPDLHMLVEGGRIRLFNGPKENHCRPAIDPMFRSVALHYAERAVGVVLSGYLDDGTAGLQAIKLCGGVAVVQDPATAIERSMPDSALANVDVDHCVPVGEMPALFARLAAAPAVPQASTRAEGVRREQDMLEGKNTMENLAAVAKPSSLTCPDCGGGLWELNDRKPLRYRCHTGHAFSAQSLASAQGETVEHSMWSGVRALQEKEMLLRRVATVAAAQGDEAQASACRRQADHAKAQARELAEMIEKGPSG